MTIHADQGNQKIHKEVYGQFAEHLGSCIYGGLWVGENSQIPNINGYRKDVFEALKNLQIPVLRWPGGCFADEYHWMDGIGPREKRPKMQNNNWGGTIEDNSFGTHEFLNLCEMLGCEPYISGNVGSGTVEELAKWVEYMTSDGDTPMAKLRRQNGRDKAWKVKFLGVGNESWGCGGDMRPEYYADLYRRYAVYCRNYDGNNLYKIASGASDYDYNWTKVLMNNVGHRMHGLSLHYYTVTGWTGSKGSATNFDKDQYYWTIGKCLEIEDVIKKHKKIIFNGNNYGEEWKKEAAKRGLPNLRTTPEAIKPLVKPENIALFEKYGVFNRVELKSRYEIFLEEYERKIGIEAGLALKLARTHIIPAVAAYLQNLGKSLEAEKLAGVKKSKLGAYAQKISARLGALIDASDSLEREIAGGKNLAKVLEKMAELRKIADAAEGDVDNELWTLPKYCEMLFVY